MAETQCDKSESPRVLCARHQTQKERHSCKLPGSGKTDPCETRGKQLGDGNAPCPDRTHLSKFTTCTLCSVNYITYKLYFPKQLIYIKRERA